MGVQIQESQIDPWSLRSTLGDSTPGVSDSPLEAQMHPPPGASDLALGPQTHPWSLRFIPGGSDGLLELHSTTGASDPALEAQIQPLGGSDSPLEPQIHPWSLSWDLRFIPGAFPWNFTSAPDFLLCRLRGTPGVSDPPWGLRSTPGASLGISSPPLEVQSHPWSLRSTPGAIERHVDARRDE